MIPPSLCPYKCLTATPCWNCANYIAQTDQCTLASIDIRQANNTGASRKEVNHSYYDYLGQHSNASSITYKEQQELYERRREELMQLSKETLVDLIINPPKY